MLAGAKLLELYNRLYSAYGPQHWWPAETAFEIMVGAVLTQNTAWSNVEKAIAGLRAADLLSPHGIATAPLTSLEGAIRPSGYYRQKARRLQGVVRAVYGSASDLQEYLAGPTPEVREKLLSLRGIGPETADSILLYAASAHPTFVVDAYTQRLVARYPLPVPQGPGDAYDRTKGYFEAQLEPDLELYRELHALIVRLGATHCRARPLCGTCPLRRGCAQKV